MSAPTSSAGQTLGGREGIAHHLGAAPAQRGQALAIAAQPHVGAVEGDLGGQRPLGLLLGHLDGEARGQLVAQRGGGRRQRHERRRDRR